MTGLDDLVGEEYGPVPIEPTPDRVAEFVVATGDDPDRWASVVPPSFANASLFAVAPRFLEDPRVVPFTRSLIHSEQRFEWTRPALVGATIDVVGRVGAARQRAGLNLVSFEVSASSDGVPWLSGSAQFLLSTEAAAAAAEEKEPPASERPPHDPPGGSLPLPGVGEALEPMRVGASRLDLVRYAAASGDWNPIHRDHWSAVAAGLPGTIVHGLLMTAWMGQLAARYSTANLPLQSLTVRFRKALRPAVPAAVTGTVAERAETGTDLDLVLDAGSERLITGTARVTP
ncbi:MAG TPA: MaoC/PaaZ C-terminal domain-containing protein [Acidimicrobiia bacterium]|nr:MaoC/PaaZ C-terminal domain-containing protein [Acidimicrobiia bacterium]